MAFSFRGLRCFPSTAAAVINAFAKAKAKCLKHIFRKVLMPFQVKCLLWVKAPNARIVLWLITTYEQILLSIYAHIPKGRKCGGRSSKRGVTRLLVQILPPLLKVRPRKTVLQWKVVKKYLAPGHACFLLKSWEMVASSCYLFVHIQCSFPGL